MSFVIYLLKMHFANLHATALTNAWMSSFFDSSVVAHSVQPYSIVLGIRKRTFGSLG